MTKIIIDDGLDMEHDTFRLGEEVEEEDCGIYTLYNTREVAMRIAYNVIDEEHITEKSIEKVIDKYLSTFKGVLLSETVEILDNNGYGLTDESDSND